MKGIATILIFLTTFLAISQDKTSVQLTGTILHPPNDTIAILCFSYGELIDKEIIIGDFYELQLGERLQYDILISSGNKVKACGINTNMMKVEKIVVDCDFNSPYNCEIYLDRSTADYFTLMVYDRYRVKLNRIERTYSEY